MRRFGKFRVLSSSRWHILRLTMTAFAHMPCQLFPQEDVNLDGNAYCVMALTWDEGSLALQGLYRDGPVVSGGDGW